MVIQMSMCRVVLRYRIISILSFQWFYPRYSMNCDIWVTMYATSGRLHAMIYNIHPISDRCGRVSMSDHSPLLVGDSFSVIVSPGSRGFTTLFASWWLNRFRTSSMYLVCFIARSRPWSHDWPLFPVWNWLSPVPSSWMSILARSWLLLSF